MISKTELNERVREWGLREDVVEKDYVIGWLLWGIGSNPALSTSWAFKGGTCLKKCYLETYRFSEDLDFTVLPGGLIKPDEVLSSLQDVFKRIYDQIGIDFRERIPIIRQRPNGNSIEGRVYYRGPRNAPDLASIKLDLTTAELVVQPTVLQRISHSYPEELPPTVTVRCYGFEELFAEKLRAMGERCRPRDLYDIINLYRRPEFRSHAQLIRTVYSEKCKSKGVELFTFESIDSSPNRSELETEWANMLGHQLPVLPPFENFWNELPHLFDWLDGKSVPEVLPAIPLATNEEPGWTPPPTIWVWGQGVPFEPVRFAAANHLCVDLGYGGSQRTIEPYSLRRTRDGHLLLYGVKVQTNELRSYRVDRIQNINVTNQPFKPRFTIEFTSTGPITTPPTQKLIALHAPSFKNGIVYVIECTVCGKQFRRSTHDTHLMPHKDKDGDFDCPGRSGYEVDRQYE